MVVLGNLSLAIATTANLSAPLAISEYVALV